MKHLYSETKVYVNMKPFGTMIVKGNWVNIIQEKTKFLKNKGFNRDMIKGYLIAQGYTEREINQSI